MPNQTIDRKCHWLRKNTRAKRPEWLLFIDTESSLSPDGDGREKHEFYLGWACLCHYTPETGLEQIGWYEIADPVDFWHMCSLFAYEHKQIYVISHNIDYDSRCLKAYSILPGIGWTPAYLIVSDSCKFVTFEADKNRISLLDNLNYWPMSLEELGTEFGIDKLDIDFTTASRKELSIYCKRDVKILVTVWEYWLEFLDKHDLGNWGITTASQSWNAYRHRFMPTKIGIHNRLDAITLERDSYKGGRCEIWKVGKFLGGPFYKLDVNGLYAYCMKTYPSPQKLFKVVVDVTPEYLSRLLETYLCIADVILDTDQPICPIRLDGKNVFPTGIFRATLTTNELRIALEHDHIKAMGQVALYIPKHLFTAFIDYFTPLRQEYKSAGDKAKSLMCKTIRNSLYGKFGQRGYQQEKLGDAPLDAIAVTRWIDAETGEKCIDWTFGGATIRQYYKGESKDSFPGIASHIAANARLVLWDYACKAGQSNVYYADTDSLIVNQAGYDNLTPWIDPLELGCLKVEGTSADLEIIAKKSYRFANKRTIKGIKKNATQDKHGRWHQTHFTSLKWAFAAGELDDVTTYEVTKEEHPTLYHGMIDDQNNVIPPRLSLDAGQVAEIVGPSDPILWDWWVDPLWFQALPSYPRKEYLPPWFLDALDAPQAAV